MCFALVTSQRALIGRQSAATGRDVREDAVSHARGGGHRCARAPGRAHAERDGRSEATPRRLQKASGSKERISRTCLCLERLFFFSRRFGNPTDRDDPVLVSHDARRDLDVRTETNLAGPIDVPLSWTIFAVKERALAAWPEPSPVFSKPAPPGPHALKLILNGRVLDNGKTLRDAKVASDAVVTCHLMVQVKLPPPSRGMAHADGKALAPGCGCVVS